MNSNLIYVGGLPRSGSTWLGNVIGAHSKVRYYHEPFHPGRNHKLNPFNNFFQYLSQNSNTELAKKASFYVEQLTFSVPRLYDVQDIRNQRKISFWYHFLHKQYSQFKQQVPLIKDPPAILISEWLDRHFDVKMIFTIRHPAAFVNSSKKAKWHYGFQTFLHQPELMEDYLFSFEKEMNADIALGEQKYSLENATLFWRIMQHVINEYYRKYSEWFFVRHEDLLINPIKEFEKLFDFINLEMDQSAKNYLNQSIKVDDGTNKARLKRDPKEVLTEWKQGLSKAEIEYIKISSQSEWELFYSESDW
ncbi:MAG: sulfotransferase [Vicingaceae bacterium]